MNGKGRKDKRMKIGGWDDCIIDFRGIVAYGHKRFGALDPQFLWG